MKGIGMKMVVVTSIVLFAVAVTSALNIPFQFVFYLVVLGQLVWIFTIYKVLTDDYKTEKTFDDWYEDNPVKKDL